ncbi:MAG: 30S ribosomal protein S9 [Deltaproteobacteria bacterium]|nr:30S ribosomal protein S9 [Deltaproteobacteria bacterium]
MAEQAYHAVGKRKTAVARVWLKPGQGLITVNKKPVDEYFTREADRLLIKQPLELTDMVGKYDIQATVRGSGHTGQAGAIRHGISRALVDVNADLRVPLKKASLLTRDPRMKERKKYGQPGARARYQYSKR